jgi:hypothetical protein
VTRNQFIQLLHHYSDSSSDHTQGVLELKKQYPYCQVLHALAARLSRDHGLPSHQHELQLAAVYASDRTALKNVMNRTTDPWPLSHEAQGQVHTEQPVSIATQAITTELVADSEEGEDLADEVQHDLEKLSQLRHNFEMLFVEAKPGSVHFQPTDESGPKEEKEEKKRPMPPGRKPGRSRAQRIVELARQLEAKEQEGEAETDEIIEEIKNSKKKVSPAGEKQREQINLIDNFIKIQPVIPSLKEKPPPTGDLSGAQSTDFSDNIISETLATLLISQGKKEKAIEVLKKLIWKFPQKKAYFAAQIEELKK